MRQAAKLFLLAIVCLFLAICGCSDSDSDSDDDTPPPEEKNEVSIIRDAYGVPHIYAEDVYGVFYGFGYSIAKDRLFQMEMAKRSVLGTVAEVLGEDYVDHDRAIRSNYTPSSIQGQYDALSDSDKDIFRGYADGVNSHIDEIEANADTLMPKQFNDFGFSPTRWTPFDVVMIFVGTMCNRYSDFNTEIDNVAYYEYLVATHGENAAMQIFNQTKWLNDPDAPTTVPSSSATVKAQDSIRFANIPTSKWEKKTIAAHRQRAHELKEKFETIGGADFNQFPLASNCWIVGKDKAVDANAMLINGPQFRLFNPGYVYAVGLHGGGFDVVGNSAFGYPAIMFGYNPHITWGSTAGLGDLVDIYRETLNPENSHQYWYNDQWRDMEHRTETIAVKGGEPITIDVYSTVHGLVVQFDEENNIAYSKKRTWDGLEVESLMGWIESTKAKNFAEWHQAASKMAITINWYYADENGNIGYAHTGKYPIRPANQDVRFPVSGSGDMEWKGILPFSSNPQVFNPGQGFIANWNNKPAEFWHDPDMWWLSWGSADRINNIISELESKEQFTADELWEINERLSFVDLNISYFLPFLQAAVDGLAENSDEVRAVNMLSAWDGYRKDADGDGFYDDPAKTIMQEWLGVMLSNTLADDIQDFFWMYSSTGYPSGPPGGGQNVASGVKILYHALLGEGSSVPNNYGFFNGADPETVVLNSLSQALDNLRGTYGNDMTAWLLPVVGDVLQTSNFFGVPQANENEALTLPIFMNRGTENDFVIFRDDGVVGYDVHPPGQSGFVASDGTKDQHYQDQMALYRNFEYKRQWLFEDDVRANAASEETITY